MSETKQFLGRVYKITNSVNDMIYVGSTKTTLERRFTHHKSSAKTHNFKLYKSMQDIGIDKFSIELLEEKYFDNDDELKKLEQEYINKYDISILLNERNAFISEQDRQEQIKEYREKNKQQINEKAKEWCKKNREQINDKSKKYYEANKDQINEKGRERFTCICGSELNRSSKSRHERESKKHKNYIEKQNNTNIQNVQNLTINNYY